MKIKENRTTYHCEFCSKFLFKKSAMIKHEANCSNNPDNSKACYNCDFLKREEIEVFFDSGRYEEDGDLKQVEVFKCSKLDKYMFPFSIERKELHKKYPETYQDQEPMPRKCSHFKEIFSDIF